MSQALAQNPDSLVAALSAALGADAVVTDDAALALYAHDVYQSGAPLAAVLRPATVEALASALPILAAHDADVIARGGGMSYTDTYLAKHAGAVLLDMSELNRVIEINADDMYVTVECGCTWKALAEALQPHGVRTPYWGPLSGMRATVGGALSQGSIFLGSGQHGSAADNVQSLDVLRADGELIQTGSRVNSLAKPFYRNYGPDLTGLFTGDCGALGVKVRATLPLKRIPPEARYASFSYTSAADLLTTMAELAREDLVSECFAFDPGLQAQRLKRSSVVEDVKSLARVVKGSGSKLKGIGESLKIAAAGRRFLGAEDFSMHVSLDGRSAVDADDKLRRVREISTARGKEVENTIPKVMRADPFANVNSMLGPNGERWVPVHGIVALSDAADVFARCEEVFARHDESLQALSIDTGVLMCTVGSSATLIEPCLYWPDTQPLFQSETMDKDFLSKLNTYDENPAARDKIAILREELTAVLHQSGATHFQIGKFYPYRVDANPGATELLEAIKQHVDAHGHFNPGALGLDR